MYRNKKSSSMKKKHSLVNLTFINGFHCQCVRIWNGRLFHTTWPVSINHYAFEIIREPKYIVSLTIHSLTHSKSFSICNGVDHNHQWTMFMSVCVRFFSTLLFCFLLTCLLQNVFTLNAIHSVIAIYLSDWECLNNLLKQWPRTTHMKKKLITKYRSTLNGFCVLMLINKCLSFVDAVISFVLNGSIKLSLNKWQFLISICKLWSLSCSALNHSKGEKKCICVCTRERPKFDMGKEWKHPIGNEMKKLNFYLAVVHYARDSLALILFAIAKIFFASVFFCRWKTVF